MSICPHCGTTTDNGSGHICSGCQSTVDNLGSFAAKTKPICLRCEERDKKIEEFKKWLYWVGSATWKVLDKMKELGL